MSRSSILSLAGLLVALPLATAFAQDSLRRPSPNEAILPVSRSTDTEQCPVGLAAKHAPASSLLEAGTIAMPDARAPIDGVVLGDRSSQPREPYQRLQLTASNPSFKNIASLQLIVHGMSDRWRTVPLGLSPAVPNLSKKLEVAMDLRGNGHAAKDLLLHRFTTVTSIDLASITYADGSSWRASVPGACRVVPDSLMLLSASN